MQASYIYLYLPILSEIQVAKGLNMSSGFAVSYGADTGCNLHSFWTYDHISLSCLSGSVYPIPQPCFIIVVASSNYLASHTSVICLAAPCVLNSPTAYGNPWHTNQMRTHNVSHHHPTTQSCLLKVKHVSISRCSNQLDKKTYMQGTANKSNRISSSNTCVWYRKQST